MLNCGIIRKSFTAGFVAVGLAWMAQVAVAQNPPPIAVGSTAPVPERQGLLGTYYSIPTNTNFNQASAGSPPNGPGSSPTSPMTVPPVVPGFVLLGEQLDTNFNINFQTTVPPLNSGNPGGATNYFMIEWTGRLNVTQAGAYTFYCSSDDGERLWVGNVGTQNPILDKWCQRGAPAAPGDTSAVQNLVVGLIDVRAEYEQGNGGTSYHLQWSGPPSGTPTTIPASAFRPPPGPAAPTLTATPFVGPPPPQVTLNWTASPGATGYILNRNGVVYQVLGNVTTFVDTNVSFGTAYTYTVQATSHLTICIGPASNQQTVTPTLPDITVTPNTGLQTNENLSIAVATITFNRALANGQTVNFTITSSDGGEGIVRSSGVGFLTSISFPINGPVAVGAQIPLEIQGVDDSVVDGPQNYTVSITTSGQFGAVAIPPLNCTNNDNDTPGITVSRTSGLRTSESGGQDSFTIVLNTQPTGDVTVSLTSSNALEGTVSAPGLTFTGGAGGNWGVAQTVTVTGVDDPVLDFPIAYTIVTGNLASTDPNYNNMVVPDVSVLNLDNEVPPELPTVWGDAGGCGLTGPELALPWFLALLLRRRRRTR